MPNPQGRNGYAIAPSDEAIRPLVERFVASGYTNPEIISCLREQNFNISYVASSQSCLYWGGSLVGMAYTFVDEMLKTGKVSQDVVDLIPHLRVVRAALAIPDGLDGSLDAIYLVEEKIHGRFIKYINNNSAVAADSLHGREVVIGLFLCFVQHVQYQLTNSMVYLSDFQGAGDLLTDCQVITGSDFANNFGDGNCTIAFDDFKSEHKCNKFCHAFGLQAFM